MMKTKTILVGIMLAMVLTGCGKAAETEPVETKPAETESVTEETTEQIIVTDGESDEDNEANIEANNEANIEANIEEEGEIMGEAATLLYQGHASIRISTPEGKTIYVDPFMGEGYDVPADLILETHGHYDHTQTDLIESKNDDCQTITWAESIKDGEHQTFDLGYVQVEAVEAGYNKNHDAKQCVGFILTFSNGVTLYLSGDTSTTPQMSELADRELDYAFFCCDGVYNMDMSEAIECAKLVGAKHSIPYHMVPANNSEGFDQSVAEQFDVPGSMIVRPGEEIVLE